MITTTWTAPSADLLGLGGADVRTIGSALSGAAAPLQGTGLPAVACERTAPVTASLATARTDALVVGRRRVHAPIAERFIAPSYLPTNDGTTLGIHPSGRPQS
ncbi:hypothetical protein [Blastococcus saxobsidens]|uniref:Uncharacterized protein n=1 Tax=Blastococcus saxobsidens TaxID=138336 RepID=A0A4Q7Y7D5_9ACTN|nr:hypothetical protein [Blastococcus saxobsidens]RZU32947.1 hypothetical protein BKA19_2662 [Blastococcus saxobsidens]